MDRPDKKPLSIAGAQAARRMDELAGQLYCLDPGLLMEDAALAAFFLLRDSGYLVPGSTVFILCGGGNNGGDGLALARLLYARQFTTVVVMACDPDEKSLCGIQKKRFESMGTKCLSAETFLEHPGAAESCGIIVDALLGTGLSRKPEGVYRALVDWINGHKAFTLSLDIPSGLDSDTGEASGVCVKADATLCFGILKKGLLLNDGCRNSGRLGFSPLSFTQYMPVGGVSSFLNEPLPLAARAPDGHKGTFGKILTVAGSSQYRGAPGFAALSVLKGGAGISVLACPESIASSMTVWCPELVILPLPENGGHINKDAGDQILKAMTGIKGMILGPGLSVGTGPEAVIRQLTIHADCPLLIDGDALTVLSGCPDLISGRKALTALTPHPGELARLLDTSVNNIESDREKAVKEAVDRFNCPVILKGHRTLIGFPDGSIFWNLTGNSGMATAGTGDILSGLVMGLYSVGNSWETALLAGVYIHGLAGDLAASETGQDSLMATDLLRNLSKALQQYRNGDTTPLVSTF
jgi:NAD(P)H-hydrate epimerase